MAKIGLSRPYYAKYANSGTTVTYSDGGRLGKFTEISITVDSTDENVLYADNAAAESDKTFAGGSVALTTDDLSPAALVAALGLTSTAISDADVTTQGAAWTNFDDDQAIPYLGIGGIIKRRVGGATKWQAFILPKVQLSNPSMAVTTQGETIEWQTQEIDGTIMRADDAKHCWQRLSTYLDTEEEAAAAIKSALNITES